MKSQRLVQYLLIISLAFATNIGAQEHTNLALQSQAPKSPSASKSVSNTNGFVSLNCAVIQSDLKKMMCASPEIMAAESKLRDLYQQVEAQTREPQVLFGQQKDWRKKLAECKSEKCILERFRSQESMLSTWIANEKKRLQEKENCQGKACWPEGSAMHTAYVLSEELEQLTPALQLQFEKLLRLLSNTQGSNGRPYFDSRILSGIELQQRGWKKYIEDECELVGALTGAGGTWPTTWALDCQVTQMKNRLLDVKKVTACIEKIPRETRWIDQDVCIRELITLSKNVNPS